VIGFLNTTAIASGDAGRDPQEGTAMKTVSNHFNFTKTG